MSAQYPEAVRALFKKNFDFYDYDKIFRIQTEDIPALVRVCGAIPLEADIERIQQIADPDKRGSVDFESFCKALRFAFDVTLREQDAKRAFYCFDSDKRGLICQHELRYILTTMGDKFSVEEMNTMIEEVRSEVDMEGNFVMMDIVYKMTPEMYKM